MHYFFERSYHKSWWGCSEWLKSRVHFVYAPSQWETTLHYKVGSHWLGAYTKWFLKVRDVLEASTWRYTISKHKWQIRQTLLFVIHLDREIPEYVMLSLCNMISKLHVSTNNRNRALYHHGQRAKYHPFRNWLEKATLTHWGWDKMHAIFRRHFQMNSIEWKLVHFDSNYPEICSWWSN